MFGHRLGAYCRGHQRGTGYAASMTVLAREVAAALRDRLPGLPLKKLHKLLYYCQAHHLAATGDPLFSDTVSAWDMGPVVGPLWHSERTDGPAAPTIALTEAQLNTIGYVVSRYGGLSGRDLEHLTHAEEPWRRADQHRQLGNSVRIEHDWMREYFTADATDTGTEDFEVALDPAEVTDWLRDAPHRRHEHLRSDSYEELRLRVHAS